MNSGSRPCAPRYFEVTASPSPGPICDCAFCAAQRVAATAADARDDGGIVPRELRDDALDRTAGRELNDDEADQHDPEQRRDDQQQALQKIGGHQGRCRFSVVGFNFAAFVGIIPPGVDHAWIVFGLHRWPRELVPVGNIVRGLVPVWHPIMTGAQHAVDGARRGQQIGAGLRCVTLSISASTAGSLDAGKVEAAVHGGRAPSPRSSCSSTPGVSRSE